MFTCQYETVKSLNQSKSAETVWPYIEENPYLAGPDVGSIGLMADKRNYGKERLNPKL